MRDYQQQRVYDWQTTVPNGGQILIENAQSIVDHIWKAEGLDFPPRVVPIDCRTTKWAGKANRLKIWLQPVVCLRTIIHEMAHSMTANIDGESCMHGPEFVGVYMQLIEKYLNVPRPVQFFTAQKYNVDFNPTASPVFLDN